MKKPQRYRAICRYITECTCTMPVMAQTKEEASKKAKDKFNKWNDTWVKKYHGNPKELIDIEIQE